MGLLDSVVNAVTGKKADTSGEVAKGLSKVAAGKMPYGSEATQAMKGLSAAREMASVNKIINKKAGTVITNDDRINSRRYAQRQLGLKPTGILSAADKTAIEAFQGKHGLGVDGDPGRNTLKALRKDASCGPDSVVLKMPNGNSQCFSSAEVKSVSRLAVLAGGPAAPAVALLMESPEMQQIAAAVFNGGVEAVGSPEAKAALGEARKLGGKAWDGISGGLGAVADKSKEVGSDILDGAKKFSKDTGLSTAAGKVGSFFKDLTKSSGGSSQKTNNQQSQNSDR